MITLKKQGFSILMAIGITAILLVLTTGLALLYMQEFRLSRFSYDEVIAQAAAEGVFEYGMLKVRNHRDGFSDAMIAADPDAALFKFDTPRTKGIEVGYTLKTQSQSHTFSGVAPESHLIVPLFVGTGVMLSDHSADPRKDVRIIRTQGLRVQGIGQTPWTIMAMSGGTSIGMTGSGNIGPRTEGTIRTRTAQCYNANAKRVSCEGNDVAEELVYLYDRKMTIQEFLADTTEAYLMIYNNDTQPKNITIASNTPFALPTAHIEAFAKHGDALQVFSFTEDKSRYYDAIKYGAYSTEESPTP